MDCPRDVSGAEWALIIVAIITTGGVLVNARYGRMARIERRLALVEAMNHRLWFFIRQQHDHAYRNGIAPLPIPEELFENDKDDDK